MIEHCIIHSQFDQLPIDILISAPCHPHAIIQFSHGMCEHKERYRDFISFLNKHGYACCIHDHRGHGQSIRQKDDLGYLYDYAETALVEDLHQLTVFMKKRYPDLPIYLCGHSMGSLIVKCYLQKYDQDVDGVIFMGYPRYHSLCYPILLLTSILTKIRNDHYRPHKLFFIADRLLNRKYNTQTEYSWISSDTQTVTTFNQDPFCHFSYTINGLQTIIRLMIKAHQKQINACHQDLFILFLAGTSDPFLMSKKNIADTIQQFKKADYQKISFHLFKDMRHELLNETKKELVYHYILKTLQSWQNTK